MNSDRKEVTRAIVLVGLAGIFITAFAITPLAVAGTLSSNNQIEIIRAQTHYKLAADQITDPPVASVFSASLSPDLTLARNAASQGASLLQAAGDS
jgi:hypothetical protein